MSYTSFELIRRHGTTDTINMEENMPATKPFIRSEDRQIVQELHQSFDERHPIPENYVINTVEPDNRTVIIPGEWNGHAEVFADNIDNPESYGVYVESRFGYGHGTKIADFRGDNGLYFAGVLANRLQVIGANCYEARGFNVKTDYKQLVAEQEALDNWENEVQRPAISDEDMRTAQAIRARDIQRVLSVSSRDEEVRFMQKAAREGIPFGDYMLPGDCEMWWGHNSFTADVRSWMGDDGEIHEDPQTIEVRVNRYAREETELVASFTGEDARVQAEELAERLNVIAAYAEIRPLRQRERFAQLLASRERQAEQTQAAPQAVPQPAPQKPYISAQDERIANNNLHWDAPAELPSDDDEARRIYSHLEHAPILPTGYFEMVDGSSAGSTVEQALKIAQKEGANRLIYVSDDKLYTKVDGKVVKQVDQVGGHWWVRHKVTDDPSTPPSIYDTPLSELQEHMENRALSNIEVRHHRRQKFPPKETDYLKREDAERRDKKHAQDDIYNLLIISTPNKRAQAAALMLENWERYPTYRNMLEFGSDKTVPRLQELAVTVQPKKAQEQEQAPSPAPETKLTRKAEEQSRGSEQALWGGANKSGFLAEVSERIVEHLKTVMQTGDAANQAREQAKQQPRRARGR